MKAGLTYGQQEAKKSPCPQCGEPMTVFSKTCRACYTHRKIEDGIKQSTHNTIRKKQVVHGNNNLKPCVAKSVIELVRLGASVRTIMQMAGVAKGTVLRYKRIFLADGGEINSCDCGRVSGHRGWCHSRVAGSQPRQALLRRWGRLGGNQNELQT